MSDLLFDAAGRRRSPARCRDSTPGRPPRNKGIRYPAGPPTVEEIVSVDADRWRRSAWSSAARPGRCPLVARGYASTRRSRSATLIWTAVADRCSCAAARAAAVARAGMDERPGTSLSRGAPRPRASDRPTVRCRQRPHARAAVVSRRRAHPAPANRGGRRRASTLRAPSATPRARGRDGPRGRPADRHPATARPPQPRHHLDLSPRHRQRRNHRHRPRSPSADGSREHLASAVKRRTDALRAK